MSVAYQTQDELSAHYKAVRNRLWPKAVATPVVRQPSQPSQPVIRDGRDILDLRPAPPNLLVPIVIYNWPIGPVQEITATEMPDTKFARLVLRRACEEYEVTQKAICSDQRNQHIVRARHEVCWILHKHTGWSLPHIGRFLGDRDHTTILHAIRAHQSRINKGLARELTREDVVLSPVVKRPPTEIRIRDDNRFAWERRKFLMARARLIEALL